MRDIHSVAKIALLHPKWRADAQLFIEDIEDAFDITVCIVQGLRTFAQQQAIYDQGRTTPGPVVTKAQAGQSYHNYGIAVDLCPFKATGVDLDWEYDFSQWLPYAKKYNITWGGSFPSPDRDHWENKYGYNWRSLLAMYQAAKFIPGTQYVDI